MPPFRRGSDEAEPLKPACAGYAPILAYGGAEVKAIVPVA